MTDGNLGFGIVGRDCSIVGFQSNPRIPLRVELRPRMPKHLLEPGENRPAPLQARIGELNLSVSEHLDLDLVFEFDQSST